MIARARTRHLRVFWTLALSAAAAGCASTGAVPKPFPVPGSSATAPRSNDKPTTPAGAARLPVDGYALAGTALALRGTPYRNGGSDPQGFDCSGFTQYVFAQYGVSLPRDVREQFRMGNPVDPVDVAPGDLVFFTTTEPGA